MRVMLSSLTRLLHGVLAENDITAAGARHLAAGLSSSNCKLTSLLIERTCVAPAWDAVVLGAAFVTTLALSPVLASDHPRCSFHGAAGNELGAQGAAELAQAISSPHCTLTVLNLRCTIGAAAPLADCPPRSQIAVPSSRNGGACCSRDSLSHRRRRNSCDCKGARELKQSFGLS